MPEDNEKLEVGAEAPQKPARKRRRKATPKKEAIPEKPKPLEERPPVEAKKEEPKPPVEVSRGNAVVQKFLERRRNV